MKWHEELPTGRWTVAEHPHGYWVIIRKDHGGGTHSRSFATKEEAEIAFQEMEAQGRCQECGDVLYTRYSGSIPEEILSRQLCFSCLFWTKLLEESEDPDVLVVEGRRYRIGPQPPIREGRVVNAHAYGFGGSRFELRFFDDREDRGTNNLWTQGKVPPHFRERMPDTAEFKR